MFFWVYAFPDSYPKKGLQGRLWVGSRRFGFGTSSLHIIPTNGNYYLGFRV